jgi:hypothetical protein
MFFSSSTINRSIVSLTLCTAISAGVAVLPTTAQVATGSNSSDASTCGPDSTNIRGDKAATNADGETADYILQAETSMAPRTFEHESFSLKSIVKSSVVFYPANSECNKSVYEKIWYQDGRPLGMERQAALSFPAEKNVGIKIVQAPCATFDESKAASNVIMRLVLDVLKNRDKISLVTVPSASYTTILMELQRRKASVMPPGEDAPEGAKVKFKLESGSTGMKQMVYFM